MDDINSSKTATSVMDFEADHHPYIRKKFGCPCPGLAILLNHGFLKPKDPYERIPVWELIEALVNGFNMSWIHAAFLSIAAVLMCGKKLSVSIEELGVHDRIEHDGSITRHDYANGSGDCLNPDESLINRFVQPEEKPQISLSEYADCRANLHDSAREPFSLKTRLLSLGEVGLTIAIFGKQKKYIDSASLRTVFLEERMPEGWKKPEKKVTILDIVKIGWCLNQMIQKNRKLLPP